MFDVQSAGSVRCCWTYARTLPEPVRLSAVRERMHVMTDGQGDEGLAGMRAELREMNRRINEQPQVFTEVKDRDLVTLMDQFAGSLEFHSMLVAAQLMREVSRRNLWDAVVERRAALLARAVESADPEKLRQQAKASLDRFRDEHFPVDPDLFDEPDGPAAEAWNSYIQF